MKPEIYAIQRGRSGWKLSRRDLAAAAALAGVSAMPGCGPGEKPSPGLGGAAHKERVMSLAFGSDGKLLASGSGDGTVKLWSLPEGALLKTLAGGLFVAIGPNGKLMVSGSVDLGVKLWSLPAGALIKAFAGARPPLAISPDGRLLAASGRFGTIKLWSLPDGAALKTLTGGTAAVYSVAISPDGKLLASGGGDRTIRLWSLPEGQPLPTCLMDVDASSTDARGIQYTRGGASYTQSCGSPVPADAVCTCNCVPGKQRACPAHVSCSCVGHSGGGSGGGSHYWHPN